MKARECLILGSTENFNVVHFIPAPRASFEVAHFPTSLARERGFPWGLSCFELKNCLKPKVLARVSGWYFDTSL